MTHVFPWITERLADRHDRESFTCGKEPLDHLKLLAGQDLKRGGGVPFVGVEPGHPSRICGYYTLSSHGIEPTALPPETAKKLPRYPLLPATMLGRLARDSAFAGRGLGEFLSLDALHRAYRGSKEIASTAVIVGALDEAHAFYLHFDFAEFPESPNRLFLPMREIAALFPEPLDRKP